jgi:hypothetical protein
VGTKRATGDGQATEDGSDEEPRITTMRVRTHLGFRF